MSKIICLDCGDDYQDHEHKDHPFRSATVSEEAFDSDEVEELLNLADVIGARIAVGDLPPKDANGFYIL